jgi:small-conductance mechanosensitive channel
MFFILGLAIKRIVLSRIVKWAEKTRFKFADVILTCMKKVIVLWFLILGGYVVVNFAFLPQNLLDLLREILVVLFLLSLFWFAAEFIGSLIQKQSERLRAALPAVAIFSNLSKIIIYVIGILVILQALGIPVTPVITTLGIGGLAVALALQDTLSNLFSGLNIVASRNIREGDYIKLDGGQEGYVVDISWKNTTIRELPNNLVIIPNTKLSSAIVTNFHLPDRELAVLVDVGVSYDSDLNKVEKVTIEVAKEVMEKVPGGVSGFEPFVRYHSFDEFSIRFTVILRGKEFIDKYLIKHEFIKRLHQRYKTEGIEIPFPTRTVYVKEKKPN